MTPEDDVAHVPGALGHVKRAPAVFHWMWFASTIATVIVTLAATNHTVKLLQIGLKMREGKEKVFIPVLGRVYIKIFLFFPLISILSWLGLLIIRFAVLFQLLLHLYEATCLIWFWQLMADLLGGPETAFQVLHLATSLSPVAVRRLLHAATLLPGDESIVSGESERSCSSARREAPPHGEACKNDVIDEHSPPSATQPGYPEDIEQTSALRTAAAEAHSVPMGHAHLPSTPGDDTGEDLGLSHRRQCSDANVRYTAVRCDSNRVDVPGMTATDGTGPALLPNSVSWVSQGHNRRWLFRGIRPYDAKQLGNHPKKKRCGVDHHRNGACIERAHSSFEPVALRKDRAQEKHQGFETAPSHVPTPRCPSSRGSSPCRVSGLPPHHSVPEGQAPRHPSGNSSTEPASSSRPHSTTGSPIGPVTLRDHALSQSHRGKRRGAGVRKALSHFCEGGEVIHKGPDMLAWTTYLRTVRFGPYNVLSVPPFCKPARYLVARPFRKNDLRLSFHLVGQYVVFATISTLSRAISQDFIILFQVLGLSSLLVAMYGLVVLFRATTRIIPREECHLEWKFAAIKIAVFAVKGSEILLRYVPIVVGYGSPYGKAVMGQAWGNLFVNLACVPIIAVAVYAYPTRDLSRRYSSFHESRSGMLIALLSNLLVSQADHPSSSVGGDGSQSSAVIAEIVVKIRDHTPTGRRAAEFD